MAGNHEILQRLTELEYQVRMLRARVRVLEGEEVHSQESMPPVQPLPVPPIAQPSPPPLSGAPATPSVLPPPIPAAIAPLRTPQPAQEAQPTWDTLRQWGLLPPRSEGDREANVGAWWTTRLGGLLGVVALVFFAIYMSQGAPPWLRWAKMLAVSCGLTLWAWRLERKVPRFGRALFGTGLSMVFFTAVAGHAFAPVRVFHTELGAIIAQLAAAGIVLAAACARGSQTIASMGVGFGFVAVFFARHYALSPFAVAAAVSLLIVAVLLRLRRGWAVPQLLGIIPFYAVLALDGRSADVLGGFLPLLLLAWAVVAASDLYALRPSRVGGAIIDRVLPALNGATAAFAGWAVFLTQSRQDIEWFYGAFGLAFLAAGFAHDRWAESGKGGGGYAAKGTALVTLCLVAAFAGYWRWLSLAAQAVVWLHAARRRRSLLWWGGAVAVWSVSLGCLILGHYAASPEPSWAAWLASLLWMGASAWMAARWAGWSVELLGGTHPRDEVRAVEAIISAMTGVAAILSLQRWCSPEWTALGATVATLVLGAAARLGEGRLSYVGAVLVWAAGWIWLARQDQGPVWPLVFGGSGLALIALGAAFVLTRMGQRGDKPDSSGLCQWGALMAASCAALAGVTMAHHLTVGGWWLGGCVLVGIASGVVMRGNFAGLAKCQDALVAAMAVAAIWSLVSWHRVAVDAPADFWAWYGALVALVFAVVGQARAKDATPLGQALFGQSYATAAASITTALLSLAVIFSAESSLARPLLTAVLALLFSILARVWKTPAAACGAACLAGASLVFVIWSWLHGGMGAPMEIWLALAALAAVAWTILELPVFAAGLHGAIPAVTWLGGIGLLLFAYLVCSASVPGLRAYTTALWGLSAVGLFMAGVWRRHKAWRMIGLAGLGIAVIRLFAVDIASTLYRILAFGAVAAVLLGVGYLYQRFRSRILGAD